jgi:hypothetical protein
MSSPQVRQHMPNTIRLKHMHTGPVCEVSMRCLRLLFRLAMVVSCVMYVWCCDGWVGALCFAAGLVLTPYATQPWQLYLT